MKFFWNMMELRSIKLSFSHILCKSFSIIITLTNLRGLAEEILSEF